MSNMYSVNAGSASLSELGQGLAAILAAPEGQTIGNFASILGRLHTELALIGEHAGAQSDDAELTNEAWLNLLEEKLPPELLNAGEREALGGFLALR